MEYRGTIQSGVVILEDASGLPEGTRVRVTAIERPQADARKNEPVPGSLGERLLKFAGGLKGLPSDLARNHDHYIHGTPRE
jgi:hypothetical protein